MYKSRIVKDPVENKQKQSAQILKEIPNNNNLFIEIKSGDSLSKLARRFYGSDSFWRVLAHANNLSTNFPQIGTTIRIPQNPRVEFINE